MEQEVGVRQQVVRAGAQAAGGAAGPLLQGAGAAVGARGAERAGGGAAGDVVAEVVLPHHLQHGAGPGALQEGPRVDSSGGSSQSITLKSASKSERKCHVKALRKPGK